MPFQRQRTFSLAGKYRHCIIALQEGIGEVHFCVEATTGDLPCRAAEDVSFRTVIEFIGKVCTYLVYCGPHCHRADGRPLRPGLAELRRRGAMWGLFFLVIGVLTFAAFGAAIAGLLI